MSNNAQTIPLVEPWFPPSYADYVKKQVLSGFLGPGSRTKEFSDGIAKYIGAKQCLLTVTGTVALSVSAFAVGLKPGDEILVPAYGVISTINAFASIGLKPRLVDVERSTGSISARNVELAISENTRAVCFVNFSGYTSPELIKIKQLCDKHEIPLIEDAACALGHSYQGRYAGNFGTVGTFSFSVPKVLTTGQGGALVTSDANLFARAAAYIDQGDLEWRKTNLNRDIGTNLRYTDIQAAFGLAQLRDLDERLALRRASYNALRAELGNYLFSVPGEEAPLHNIVFTREPENLLSHLKNSGIAAVRQYRTLSQHPAYEHLADKNYPNSDYWTEFAVYLPFGMALTPDKVRRIANEVFASRVKLEVCSEVQASSSRLKVEHTK